MSFNWKPSLYTDADSDELVALCQLQPGKAAAVTTEYIRWQRSANPAGVAQVGLARETPSGKIIGVIWLLPLRIQVGDRVYLGSQSHYALVHPDYRGRGVFSQLVDFCDQCGQRQGYRFAYGFPNPTSHPLFVHRLGWSDLGQARLFIRPLNIGRLITRRLGFKGRANGGRSLLRPRPLLPRASRVIVEKADTRDPALDAFWERVRGKYPVMVVRDTAFLHWRYTQIPGRRYVLLAARQGEHIVATIVLRDVTIEGIACGMVVDFLVEPTERGRLAGKVLLDHVADLSRSCGVDLLGCLMLPHAEEVTHLRRQGYRICPLWLQPQPFSLILTTNAAKIATKIVGDFRSWFLTMGDFDAI